MAVFLVCAAKVIRTVGFGAISVILALFLLQRGFTQTEVGLLMTATLLEDAFITTAASFIATKYGLRPILLASCAIIVIGGIVLAAAKTKWLLILAVVCGIVSPAGYEGGPFAALEQTIISQATNSQKLTKALSWYNMVGFAGAAFGALLAAVCVGAFHNAPAIQAYQLIFLCYSAGGILLALIYGLVKIDKQKSQTQKSAQVSSPALRKDNSGSRKRIAMFAGLQGIDAFGGGFIVQSLLTLWFYERYHVDATFLGPVYFWCNIVAALSFVFAPAVVKRIGLLNAMVFTHLPCSLALCAMPFLPSAAWAASLLLARSAFSSMDIPARQAYTMLIVPEGERPFANGVTTSTRAVAQALAPSVTGLLLNNVATGLPLILAGAFKSIYDISLYLCFKGTPLHHDVDDSKPQEHETANAASVEQAKPREVVGSAC